MAAPALNRVAQLAAECRGEPLIFEDLRPDLCPALEQIILHRMQVLRGRSMKSLNVGGWKSNEDFFNWPDAAVQELLGTVAEQVGTSRLVAWTMVNRAGSHHPRHQHRSAILVGVYYVTVGSENAITPTIFECDGGDLEIEPHPGRLVICRGEMWHSVPIYRGEAPRITIAFDVRR